MLQDTTPDAAESSAGDDFHILWAIQKSLKLINFHKDGLKAIAVENLSNQDLSFFDTSGGMNLGVDLTEYYGGLNFSEAERIVVSQLKYSTRTPDKDWTPARLCISRKGGIDGSIIDRLAVFYTKLSAQVDRQTVLSKLSIKLVSNRPAAEKLIAVVNAVKQFSKLQAPNAIDLNAVNKVLSVAQQKELARLYKASKLSESDFVDFINVLDFSDCDEGSRFQIEQKIISAISSLTSFRSSVEHTYLHKLIWGKMMPEQKAINTISLPDVLYAFGFHDISTIFPVKNEIIKPEILIAREQLLAIGDEIVCKENSIICMHGGAGIGKSTIVNMIPDVLPENSVTIIFDCYGGGSYLDPEDRRHKHGAGIIQLCNELSVKTGSNLLLNLAGTDEFYLKQFKERVIAALAIIRTLNPEAILAIIFDAADNSVTAAEVFDGRPFVKDVIQMEFPEGCKIILSARTERLATLDLPLETKEIQLLPFSYSETLVFLERQFTDITEEVVNEFRKLTNSVPRVMAYALELPGKSLAEKMMPLKPNGKTLEQIFRLRVKEAERKASKKEVTVFLKSLIALPRPIPFAFVKHTTALTEGNLNDIRVDLWREVLEHQQEFTFRDEDFETYLRKTYKLAKEDYAKIAVALLERAGEDEYASTHLANFLNKAEKFSELRELVIDRNYLDYPLDPVKNKEVFIDRAKTAMRNASVDFNPQDFIKLQVVAAEAAKTNKVLENILFERPDLAAKYGNLQTNQKIYFQSGNPGWFGPVHYRNAAIYARQPETIELAKQHLKKAKEWVDYRRNLEEDELEKYKLKASDLAYGAEAILHISGADKAVDWIQGWKPKQTLFEVAETLLRNLIANGSTHLADKWLKIHGDSLRIDLRLLIVQLYFLNGLKPPLDIDKMLKDIQVLFRVKTKWEGELLTAVIAFCEYCLKAGVKYERVKFILPNIQVPVPNHAPGFYSTGKSELVNLDILLRKGVILKFFENASFVNRDFYPKDLQEKFDSNDNKIKSKVEDQVKGFERIYSHLLPAYQIRAGYFFGKLPVKSHSQKIQDQLKSFANDWELNYYGRHDATGLQKFILLKLLDISFHQRGNAFVDIIMEKIEKRDLRNIDLLLSICEKLSKKKRFSEVVGQMLGHLEDIIDNANLSGRELVENYTRAAVMGSTCSLEMGKYYFDKMVIASSEIDFEVFDQIRSLRDFMEKSPPLNNPDLAVKFFRYSEYCAQKLSNWDGFPWHIIVPTLAKLDIRTAFAGVCQWDHRYVKATDKHFLELITEALAMDFLPVDVGVAFLAMNRYYYDDLQHYYRILMDKIDLKKDHQLKNEALRQMIRDIKLHRPSINNTGFVSNFLSLFKSGKFTDKNIITEFEKYISRLSTIIPEKPIEVAAKTNDKQKGESYRAVIQKQKVVDASVFKNLIASIKAGKKSEFVNFQILFEEVGINADIQQHVAFLNALVEIGDHGICYSDFETGLGIFLTAWKKNSKVNEWKSTAYEKIVRKWFSIFFYDDHISYETLKRLANILEIDHKEFAMSLIKMIPEELDDFSSSVLYQMLSVVYPLLEPENRNEILSWMLNRWIERVPEDFASTDFEGILTSGTPDEVIANFIRYNLGHPKKKIRWISAHVLRRLSRLKNGVVLKLLLEMQNEHWCHPFQDQNFTFYWISAKLYLWIAIERISKESPDVIAPLSSYMIAEIRNTDLPHAQIRYFVQSAALSIIKHDASIFSEEEIEEIINALSTPFETLNVERSEYPTERDRTELTFDFDTMDTLPYWYEPLGRIFKVSQYGVATIADKFITENWGYVGEVRKDNHIRDADYNDTSNRHGSEPRVEDLSAYYEYHGMFCAATSLLHTKQLVVVEDSWRETWQQWLEGWALCWKDFWLSDLNEPTPLIEKYWIENRDGNTDWEWDIGHGDFDSHLGLEDEQTLVVHLGAKVHYGKDYETISVRSGLVNTSTSRALLRMFQTRNANDNYINLENDQDYDDSAKHAMKKRFPQFKLDSWLFEEKTEAEGIDDNDPLFRDVSTSRIRPGNEFFKWSGCKSTDDYSYCFRENEGFDDWISSFLSWSTLKEKPEYNDFTSGGVLLKIKRDALKSFLTDIGKDLIVKIEISRRVDRRDHKYYPPYSKIYLFNANGTIETLSGNYRSW
ncbi:hypothetical protein EZ428_19290 [Pedobacter frigiditerrae]|uniref:ATP-binding protein n=1 Tax=Pedobacter frigiditerrae TaxID=2530452 RepID=A0A4R0MPL5_9SPHI|nr:hypothetical protein [Pedobacter frigiditerrae]TCC88775.1 hypothetical protein EZ428_19290 [Pedobacter frigiditerrae]